MPELAEVEFYRRRWEEAGAGKTVRTARGLSHSRVYRGLVDEFPGGVTALAKELRGTRLVDSGTHGKQMWFVFQRPQSRRLWLGIHLGLTGELRVEPSDYRPQKHDALILRLAKSALVFNDPRQFGRVRVWSGARGERAPWLRKLPPEVISAAFTFVSFRAILQRHGRAPLKAVLLKQEYFPGIGNWMADEILWRAAIHPALPAGRAATPRLAGRLHQAIRQVARDAMRVIAGVGRTRPPDLNVHIPDTWLFNHRWKNGGLCPRTRKPLRRAEIGGRTTCWSPTRQRLKK